MADVLEGMQGPDETQPIAPAISRLGPGQVASSLGLHILTFVCLTLVSSDHAIMSNSRPMTIMIEIT